MSDSPHARYRDRLRWLADDGALTRAITELGARRGWWPALAWSRLSERFDPHAPAFASLVLEHHGPPQVICRVEAFDTRPDDVADSAALPTPAGWLRVRTFPTDDGLPALPGVLASPGRAKVVSYHPGTRCTIRVEQFGQTLFAKMYASDRGRLVHRAGVSLWDASRRGELRLNVAEPDRWDANTRTLWQREVAGEPIVDRLSGTDGARLAGRIGRAAASLTRATVQVVEPEVYSGAEQMQRSTRHGAALSRLVPSLSALTATLLERLAFLHAGPDPGEPRPIHGGLHPDAWLEHGTQLGLIDFDRLSFGQPECDAGAFLGDLEADGRLRTTAAALAAAFLAGYEAVSGPLDRRLVLASQAHQQLARALRASTTIRPDGDERAGRKLRRAIDALEEVA